MVTCLLPSSASLCGSCCSSLHIMSCCSPSFDTCEATYTNRFRLPSIVTPPDICSFFQLQPAPYPAQFSRLMLKPCQVLPFRLLASFLNSFALSFPLFLFCTSSPSLLIHGLHVPFFLPLLLSLTFCCLPPSIVPPLYLNAPRTGRALFLHPSVAALLSRRFVCTAPCPCALTSSLSLPSFLFF